MRVSSAGRSSVDLLGYAVASPRNGSPWRCAPPSGLVHLPRQAHRRHAMPRARFWGFYGFDRLDCSRGSIESRFHKMALLKILKYPEASLKEPAKPVANIDGKLAGFIDSM